MNRPIAALVAAGAVLAAPLAARACPASADEPDLARMGEFPVGVTTLAVTDPDRPDLAALAAGRGPARAERRLAVTIWYPARDGAGPTKPYVTTFRHPGRPDQVLTFPGCAVPDAAPAVLKTTAPLVLISHGYGGWATYMADLAETLASHGYVVAAVDHDDPSFRDAAGFVFSFAATAVNRAADQRAVLARLANLAKAPDFRLSGVYDPGRLALIGYSMGGFGALATAGAGYDPQGPFYRRIPGDLLAPEAEGRALPAPGLKALVLISPWGGQAQNRSWTPAALAAVRVPTLVAVGDQDDVAGYEDGVKGIYDGLTGSDRYRLTFANARHNLVGADVPDSLRGSFDTLERFDEPVWRKDRLRAITRHYVLAFLDASLKGGSPYLAPTREGVLPKGFQRRWALGFSLRHDPAR